MTAFLDVDVELFIGEVQKYPEIWDNNSEDNRFKKRRDQAWAAIARVFVDDFDDLEELARVDIYKRLQNKWRNIRDSYVRHKRRKYGKKGYRYAKMLSFLEDQHKGSRSGSEVDAHDGDDTWSDADAETKLKKMLYKSGFETKEEPIVWHNDDDDSAILKRKRKSTRNQQVEFVETNLEPASCFAPEDEDKSFFDSLLPAVRLFNLDQKLEFRSDVIRLIKQIRKNGRSFRLRDESD